MYYELEPVEVSTLIGKTLTLCDRKNAGPEGDEIVFETTDGERFVMYHAQNCCESVEIEDVCGDFADLVGSPILQAEKVCSFDEPPPERVGYTPDSYTWTFYKFATAKGYVTVRWYGQSNGYYSETVTFGRDPEGEEGEE